MFRAIEVHEFPTLPDLVSHMQERFLRGADRLAAWFHPVGTTVRIMHGVPGAPHPFPELPGAVGLVVWGGAARAVIAGYGADGAEFVLEVRPEDARHIERVEV